MSEQKRVIDVEFQGETFCPFCGSKNIEDMGVHGGGDLPFKMEWGCHDCHMLWDCKPSFGWDDFVINLNKKGIQLQRKIYSDDDGEVL